MAAKLGRVIHRSHGLVILIKFIQAKPDGRLFYQRRVPSDLRHHFGGKTFIRESLGTRDLEVAAPLAQTKAKRDDILFRALRESRVSGSLIVTPELTEAAKRLMEAWGFDKTWNPGVFDRDIIDDLLLSKYGDAYLNINNDKVPSDVQEQLLGNVIKPVEAEAVRLVTNETYRHKVMQQVTLGQSLELYLKIHKKGTNPQFQAYTRRAIKHVIDTIGDLPLEAYDRTLARKVRDSISGTTGTTRRRLDVICAVFNLGLREHNLSLPNPFAGLEIPDEGLDATKRQPFTLGELGTIAKACLEKDNDLRWIVALQLETGARLGEIVGLRLEDLVLNAETPHVHIRPHLALGRTLKTPQSERKVPLVGLALWAAQRVAREPSASSWLFPRYAKDNDIKATHASNSINKWLKHIVQAEGSLGCSKSSHSFRHSMKDRLRAARVPEDIQKAILGHGSRSVADGYGQGYPLEVLRESLSLVSLSL
jgi:integrase